MIPGVTRRTLVEFAHRVHAAGWVANHDGNLSVRWSGGLAITPSGVSKVAVDSEGLCCCDLDGRRRSGGRPPSEVLLHVGAYRARDEIGAVVHAHPPHASAFSLAARSLGPIAMPDVVVSLGRSVPLVPACFPVGESASAAVTEALAHADVALLAGNGAMAVGPNLETAYLRLELLEHYARILGTSMAWFGGPAPLPADVVEAALLARVQAGLPVPPADADLEDRVRQAVREALEGRKREGAR